MTHIITANIGGKTWNTGQHVPKVLLVANVIASWISLGPFWKLVKFPMKLGTLVNSRKEQDLWAETIPSKNLQLNSQYCTKKLHKEKGSPSDMASDSSVRSETQDWGCIGRCLFHPWEKGNIIKIPSWSRVRECHDLESSDFCPSFQDSWKWTMVSFRLHFVCVIFPFHDCLHVFFRLKTDFVSTFERLGA